MAANRFGPPPSDSDSDDFDGMSFGNEFEEKKTAPPPPPRKIEDIVSEQLDDMLRNGEVDAFRRLYEENRELVDLNRPLKRCGWTPLMMACQEGLLELVKFFVIDEQLDVNKSVSTWAPLLLACSVKIEYDEATAAARSDHIMEIVKILIDHKALVNFRNRDSETPLMLAIMNGYDAVAEHLMAHGASLEVCDNSGNTPLFYACTYGRKRIVEILMRQGIIYDIVNQRGESPVDIALNKGFDDIAALFPVKEKEPMVPPDYSSFETIEELVPTAFPEWPKPAYVPDLFNLLRGMRLQNLEYLFYQAKISLPAFLLMTNDRLQELGVVFPYQRDRIMHGLMKVHSAPFDCDSLHRPSEATELPEIFDSVSSCLKSLVICETSLQYAKRSDLFNGPIKPTERTKEYQRDIEKLLREIDARAMKIHSVIKKLDKITPKPPPLHIDENAIKRIGEKNTFKRIIFKKTITACAFALILTIAYKLRK